MTYIDFGFDNFMRKDGVDLGEEITLSESGQVIGGSVIESTQLVGVNFDKIRTGVLESQSLVLGIAAGQGDVEIRSGIATGDFANSGAASGFIIGLDDSDSDKAKFYFGNDTSYLKYDGTTLTISGTLSAGTIISGLIMTDAATIGNGTTKSGTITMNIADGQGDCYIAGGTFTASTWTAANGFILGLDDSDSNKEKFFIGSSASSLDWNVSVSDTLTVKGTINATAGYIGASTAAIFESTGLNLGTTGHVRGGQTGYDTGTGFFLGYDTDAYKFSIGIPTNNKLTWSGNKLTVRGALELDFFAGDGAEGDLTATGATNLNATSTNVDASSASGQKVLNVASTTGIVAGDHIFVHQSADSTMGLWEIKKVASVQTGVSFTCTENLLNTYAATNAQVVLIPEYDLAWFQSGSSISNAAWDGTTGGIAICYAKSGVIIDSGVTLSMNAKGLRGGSSLSGTTPASSYGKAGEGSGANYDNVQKTRNGTGGAGAGFTDTTYDGAGGGSKTVGQAGDNNEGGFSVYSALSAFYSNGSHIITMGSGGGSGSINVGSGPDAYTTGAGGKGGGILIFITPFIIDLGTVTSNGQDGANGTGQGNGCYGGGGSGGFIGFFSPVIEAPTTPTVTGGNGGTNGDGGLGYYMNFFNNLRSE